MLTKRSQTQKLCAIYSTYMVFYNRQIKKSDWWLTINDGQKMDGLERQRICLNDENSCLDCGGAYLIV